MLRSSTTCSASKYRMKEAQYYFLRRGMFKLVRRWLTKDLLQQHWSEVNIDCGCLICLSLLLTSIQRVFLSFIILIEFGIGIQIWYYSDINFAISLDNQPLISRSTFELTFENDDHYQFSYRECCVCELCLGWRSCWGLGLKWGWWGWTSGGTSTMSR